jgi:outer membrane protein TolC
VRALASALVLATIASLPWPAHAETRRLTVEDVVKLALKENPRLQAARAQGRSGHELAYSAIGRMLPSIHLSEEYQHYDSVFNINFSIPGSPMAFPPIEARKQDTNMFVASADQPLVELLGLSQTYLARKTGAEAGDAQVRSAEAQMREAIETEYLRLFEAQALEQIAQASEKLLNEQVTIAKAKLKAGVLTTADVLRVQVAAANTRQQGIVAHTQALTARATLLGAIGLPADDTSVELVEPVTLLEAAKTPEPTFAPAEAEALAGRPELAQARLNAKSAHHQERARLFALFPEVDAEGAYLRSDGQVFLPNDSAYVGVRAGWTIWEWGASWFQRQAAKAQAQAASFQVEEERRQIGVEVQSRLSQAEAAKSAVGLAMETIASAEEAWRVTDAQVRAGAATTTDLLDAESALTQARLNLARARYEQAIAHVAVDRALGRTLGSSPRR